MRARVLRFHEKKCNFCFQWAQQSSQVLSDLFCCNTCFSKISDQRLTISTENSQIYKFCLFKDKPQEKEEKTEVKQRRSLQPLMKNEHRNLFLSWSNIKSLISENEISHDEIQEIYINDLEQKENKVNRSNQDNQSQYNEDNIQSFNDQLELGKSNPVYTSFIINVKEEHKKKMKDHRKVASQLWDRRLTSTRLKKKYNYHFDHQDIEKYKQSFQIQHLNIKSQSKPVQRQFGTQLQTLQLSNLKFRPQNLTNSNSRKKKYPKLLSKSTLSQRERLTDEQLKNIIFPYLQQKSQSKTSNRLMATYVKEAYCRTNLSNKMLELISFKITSIDLQCYLNLFDFNNLNVIKLVKVGLTDEQFYILLQHLQHYKVEILVLTGNNLSESILNYLQNKQLLIVREIYIGKNRISKYKSKQNIVQLRNKYVIHI